MPILGYRIANLTASCLTLSANPLIATRVVQRHSVFSLTRSKQLPCMANINRCLFSERNTKMKHDTLLSKHP